MPIGFGETAKADFIAQNENFDQKQIASCTEHASLMMLCRDDQIKIKITSN